MLVRSRSDPPECSGPTGVGLPHQCQFQVGPILSIQGRLGPDFQRCRFRVDPSLLSVQGKSGANFQAALVPKLVRCSPVFRSSQDRAFNTAGSQRSVPPECLGPAGILPSAVSGPIGSDSPEYSGPTRARLSAVPVPSRSDPLECSVLVGAGLQVSDFQRLPVPVHSRSVPPECSGTAGVGLTVV